MALATRCPACTTVFRISTSQAAAKGGMVRCGQCRNVFNSLDALVRVEDLHVIDEVVVESTPRMTVEVDEPVTTIDGPDVPQAIEAPDDESAPVAPTHDAPTPVDREPVFGEWWLSESGASDATAEPVAATDDAPSASRDDAGRMLSGRRTDLQWPATGSAVDDASFMRPPASPARTGTAVRWTFGLLSLLATIALLAQATYLWRDDIAVRWPATRPWLAKACVPLDCRVGYPAGGDAITIESANIQPAGTAANAYVLSALLRNRDAVDLRYPHLELTLTDVQNRVVLRRTLRPEDYLPSRGATGGFGAGSELPIRVLFELNDVRFAGYRVDRFNP